MDFPFLTASIKNAGANLDVLEKGIAGAIADLQAAIESAKEDPGIPVSDFISALNGLRELSAAVSPVRFMVARGAQSVHDSRAYQRYHRATWGCDPTGELL